MNQELFDSRKARLTKLLALNAPPVIIRGEALLVCQAYAGGRWRHALYAFRVALMASWWSFVQTPVMHALCRLNLYHAGQEPDGLGCGFCLKGCAMLDEEGEGGISPEDRPVPP
jgi:hypothetical protein